MSDACGQLNMPVAIHVSDPVELALLPFAVPDSDAGARIMALGIRYTGD
jgi:hypothetical protein